MINRLMILVLLTISVEIVVAESMPPPALPDPTSTSLEISNEASTQEIKANTDKSWWVKVKEFFGFAEDDSKSTVISEATIQVGQPIPEPTIEDLTALKKGMPTEIEDGPVDVTNFSTNASNTSEVISDSNLAIKPELEEAEQKLGVSDSKQVKGILAEFADEPGEAKQLGSKATAEQSPIEPPKSTDDKNNQLEVDLPDIPVVMDLEVKTTEIVKIDENKAVSANSSTEISDNSSSEQQAVPSQGISPNADERVKKYKKQIQEKLQEKKELPIIPESQINLATSGDDSTLGNQLDNKQFKFVTDETKVLLLPNDDVVLGELSDEAKLEYMDFSSFLNLFWQNYYEVRDEPKRQEIERFIENYDDNFNSEKLLFNNESKLNALDNAFYAINKWQNNDLKAILDNYDILQLTDKNHNNMLHIAARKGNYPAAKLLLMRGVDLTAVNDRSESPMIVAKRYNQKHLEFLFKKAGLN